MDGSVLCGWELRGGWGLRKELKKLEDAGSQVDFHEAPSCKVGALFYFFREGRWKTETLRSERGFGERGE
jgi:hypothetical protein